MSPFQSIVLAASMAASTLAGAQTTTTTPVTETGVWMTFVSDELLANSGGLEWVDDSGAPTGFAFTLTSSATLRVVDLWSAGDTFALDINGTAHTTSAVPVATLDTAPTALGADAAWADSAFSRGSYLLQAGTYTVTGFLLQSVVHQGIPLNSTQGALMLAPVPEPGTWALMLAGLGTLAIRRARQAR